MTAKEMFEKLGLTLVYEDNGLLCYKEISNLNSSILGIDFYKNYKSYHIDFCQQSGSYIHFEFHNTIQKQIEELGWQI